MTTDTIFAPATARGRAGIGIIRISGPRSWDAVRLLCGDLPQVRRLSRRTVRRETDGDVLDDALVVLFAEGSSFTGEEAAELHCHGSPAVMAAVLGALGAIPGLRLAEAGEFTRRALEAGCLDLAQVEGLADLIDAETEAQRRQAVRVLSGDLGRRASGWRTDLVRSAALIAVSIDFADEDLPDGLYREADDLLEGVVLALEAELEGYKASERIRDGFEVAIVGRPNAGKSTLLNALAGREAAITSSVAGTTRDVIEVRMDIAGLPVTVLDTAGLRDGESEVEGVGIERAVVRARSADLRVFLMDGEPVPFLEPVEGDIVVAGKADLAESLGPGLRVSGKTGEGLGRLVAAIGDRLGSRAARPALIIRERHRRNLADALDALVAARRELLSGPQRIDLAGEHVRVALRALDSLVGKVDVDHLLDEIFASFCIGK
jgi:tRNA modification GTPase